MHIGQFHSQFCFSAVCFLTIALCICFICLILFLFPIAFFFYDCLISGMYCCCLSSLYAIYAGGISSRIETYVMFGLKR